jgi:ankyrin repeat protein
MKSEDEMLLAAAESGNLDAVKNALEAGADINVRNEILKESALHLAASRGFLSIVQFLLEKDADFLLTNGTDMTALHLAARDGQTHVVEFLLETVEEIPERILNDVIHVASMSVYGRPEIVQMLEDYRVEQAKPSTGGGKLADTLLLEASENGNLDDARKAIENGANVNVIDGRGMMPIHWAALRGHMEIVRALVDGDADVNGTNSAEWTPIMHASLEGHSEIVKLLLESGAVVNARTYVSGTALMFASGRGHIEIVRMLLDAGANPSIEIEGTDDEDGMTALTYAIREGNDAIADVLRDVLDKSD